MTKHTNIPLSPFDASPTERNRWLPVMSDQLRPSFERLAKQLRLEERARSEGAENRPATADSDLDETQRQVVSEIAAGANLLKQFQANQLNDAHQKIASLRMGPLDPALALAEARATVSQAKLKLGEDLQETRLVERRRYRTLRKFRRDHGLTRKADYADEPLLPTALLAALIAVEAVGNGFLFQGAVEGGLVAGWGLAAMFSAVNVALGFAGGFFGLRLLGHVKAPLKVLGGLALAVSVAAGVYWNVKIAGFREALEQGAGSESFFTTGAPNGDWLAFSSAQALALLILGLIIFLVALLKGRGGRGAYVDPYWGHRSADLTHREAEGVYRAGKDDYRQQVDQAYRSAMGELRARYADEARKVAAAREIADQAEERAAEVRDSIGEWVATGGALLRRYREENLAVRTDTPPSYFAVYPDFDAVRHGLADAAATRAVAERAVSQHESNGPILVDLERTLAALRQEETETFLAEIADIELDADRRIQRDWSDEGADVAAPVWRLAAPRPASGGA